MFAAVAVASGLEPIISPRRTVGGAPEPVGFGCAGYVRSPALQDAIDVGYTLFDTAQAQEWYLEEELGNAIGASTLATLATWRGRPSGNAKQNSMYHVFRALCVPSLLQSAAVLRISRDLV